MSEADITIDVEARIRARISILTMQICMLRIQLAMVRFGKAMRRARDRIGSRSAPGEG